MDNKGYTATDDSRSVTSSETSGSDETSIEKPDIESSSDSKPPSYKSEEEPKKKGKVGKKIDALHHSTSKRFNKKNHPLPSDPSFLQKLKYNMMWPLKGDVAMYMSITAIVLLIWGVGASVSSEFDPRYYNTGHLYALLVIISASYILGTIGEQFRLPPLLGMLIMGIILNNVPKIDVAQKLKQGDWPTVTGVLRSSCLVIILTRAGMGLDAHVLKRLSSAVMRVAFIPCVVEAVVVAVVATPLVGFTIDGEYKWQFGFMLGFILAALSPAVVIPCLLGLMDKGYGIDKGIPTLVIAAASLDDVLTISCFGIVQGITFSNTDSLALLICTAPIDIVMGIGYGVIMGVVAWYIPNKKYGQVHLLRVLFLLFGGFFAVLGSNAIDFGGAGSLATLTFSFVASHGWRRQGMFQPGNQIATTFATIWKICQPMLFGLIGAEIDVTTLDGKTVGFGILTIFAGVFLREIASFFAVMGSGLNFKERMFVSIAWLPKATVQAALAPIPLEMARNAEEEEIGRQIVTISVLSIIIMAPIGAAALAVAGPRFLERSKRSIEDEQKKLKEAEVDGDSESGGQV